MSEVPPLLWHCPHCDKPGMPLRQIWKHVNRTHHDCISCQAEVIIATMLLANDPRSWTRPILPHGKP